MKKLLNLMCAFSLLAGLPAQQALAEVTEVERKLVTEFVTKFLDAEKNLDLDAVSQYLDTDFIQISEESDEPDPTLDRDGYLEDYANWLADGQYYDYKVTVRDVYRLPDGQGYGVDSVMLEMNIIDGSYQREGYALTWSIRNSPQGFKVFKFLVQD